MGNSSFGGSTPTLSCLIAARQNDFNGRLPGADSRLRRSCLGVLATVLAGGEYGLYGYMNYLADQILPDTMDLAHLTRFASIYNQQPSPATPAAGPALISGGTPETPVPVGTTVQSGADIEYVTIAALVLDQNGDGTVQIQATTPGSAGLADAGVILNLVSPIAGVPGTWTVAEPGLTDGADTSTAAELLANVTDRIQQPPAAGTGNDYEAWAKAAGVGATRAWAYPQWMGLGTVGVTFMCDNRVDPQPQPADVAAVQAYIEAQQGVTAEVIVFAPILDEIDFTIQLAPNTATVQAAAAAELAALFIREAAPGGTVLKSHQDEAIAVAAGVTDHTIVAPGGNIVSANGHLAILGNVVWQG
jgi:uncharacterized phage protein gp47/JayE